MMMSSGWMKLKTRMHKFKKAQKAVQTSEEPLKTLFPLVGGWVSDLRDKKDENNQ